jgi:hypothetical protein
MAWIMLEDYYFIIVKKTICLDIGLLCIGSSSLKCISSENSFYHKKSYNEVTLQVFLTIILKRSSMTKWKSFPFI